MITCPKCGKDNQDHYKFCLGCGAELPRDTAPKPFSPQTPPQGIRAAQAASAGGASPAASPVQTAAPAAVQAATALAAQPIAAGLGSAPAPVAPQVAALGFGGTVAMSPQQAAGANARPLLAAALAAHGAAAAASSFGAPGTNNAASAVPPPVGAPNPGPGAAVAGLGQAPVAGTVVCPQCGHANASGNLFCGSCGFRLGPVAPRPAPAPAAAPEPQPGVLTLTALRADGSEAGTYQVPAAGIVGRETGGIFAGDSYLSPRHAAFRSAGPGRAIVKDEVSLNGVYKKLNRDVPVELRPNDVFRIGQEIIKFEPLAAPAPAADGVERLGAPSKGYVGRIALVIGRDETGNAFPIPENGIHLGRERGDILFPEDGYVSGLHCRLSWDGQRLFLTDLGSSNGTFLRITSETEIRTGDVLLMGQQLFRVAL